MTRKSLIAKEHRKQLLVEKYKVKRDNARAILKDQSACLEDKLKAQFSLQKLPTNSCRTRLRLRCSVTGRPRGVIRKFGLARTELRRMAGLGHIPGIRKASW